MIINLKEKELTSMIINEYKANNKDIIKLNIYAIKPLKSLTLIFGEYSNLLYVKELSKLITKNTLNISTLIIPINETKFF